MSLALTPVAASAASVGMVMADASSLDVQRGYGSAAPAAAHGVHGTKH